MNRVPSNPGPSDSEGPDSAPGREGGALHRLLVQCGLIGWPRFHRDPQWWGLLLAGALVACGLHLGFAGHLFVPEAPWTLLVLVLLLWQPFWEELLFRGLLQGQLLDRAWGRVKIAGLSRANLLTSLIFSASHLAVHSWPWALAVLAPSLVFGLLRERHASIHPAWLMHGLYNGAFLLAAIA